MDEEGTRKSLLTSIMKTDVYSLSREATVEEAMRLFVEKNISAAPIVDESGEPVGFISDGDILKRLSPRSNSFTDPIVPVSYTHLAEAWEAAVVEEVLFRGVLLWACLSWARRRNEAYPRRAPRAHRHRFAGLRAVVDPVGFAVMASSLIFGLAHLFPEGSLMAPGADIGVAAIQGFLKVTQSTLFGAVMALLVVCLLYTSRCV